jgi:hypothetical protein
VAAVNTRELQTHFEILVSKSLAVDAAPERKRTNGDYQNILAMKKSSGYLFPPVPSKLVKSPPCDRIRSGAKGNHGKTHNILHEIM